MLDAQALREGMELLTASLGVTLPEVTKKRHLARLERDRGAVVDQVNPFAVFGAFNSFLFTATNTGLHWCRRTSLKLRNC